MSIWAIWKQAFDHVTLKDDGDPNEKRGATQHGLDKSFANFEVFWRYHVVPATNRPANIDLNKDAAREVIQVVSVSHSLFCDLLNAADLVAKIKAGDLGGPQFRNCTDAMKSDGDAIQKFGSFQDAIEDALAKALQRKIQIWSKTDWKNIWNPSREKIIGYRNFLTHEAQPKVMLVLQTDGSCVPYVLHQNCIDRDHIPTWNEQDEIYRTSPEKWHKLSEVCEELHAQSIKWLNDAYAEVIKCLAPRLSDEDYHYLWGWDTNKHIRHVLRKAAASGAQAVPAYGLQMGSGAGIVSSVRIASNQGLP